MDFSRALARIRAGRKLRRRGWNGKGMYVSIAIGGSIHRNSMEPFIYMFTADKKYVPWLASQTDLLASDWEYADGGLSDREYADGGASGVRDLRASVDIRAQFEMARIFVEENETYCFGNTYEEGVAAALEWVLGDRADMPIDEAYDGDGDEGDGDEDWGGDEEG